MKLFGKKRKNANGIVHAGFGTVGDGIRQVQGRGEFTRQELRRLKLDPPYSLGCPDIQPLEKNALLGIRRFRLVREKLRSFLEDLFRGAKLGVMDFATGGGTGSLAALAAELAEEFTQHLSLRLYIDEHASIDFGEEGERKYLNTTIQLMLLKRQLELNPGLGLDLITMATPYCDLHLGYSELDQQILDIDSILTTISQSNGGFDLEDMLSDPRFRFRTYALRTFSILNGPDVLGSKILNEIKRLRPLFDPGIFRQNVSEKVIDLPIVVICGPESVVQEVGEFLSRGPAFQSRISLEERDQLTFSGPEDSPASYRKVVTYPLPNPQKIYIAGIYPIDSGWWFEVLEERENYFRELLKSIKEENNASMRAVVLRRMIDQAGYSGVEELLREGL